MVPEVHHHCMPGVVCLIVGTQTDLRDDPRIYDKLAKQRMQPVREEDRLIPRSLKAPTSRIAGPCFRPLDLHFSFPREVLKVGKEERTAVVGGF